MRGCAHRVVIASIGELPPAGMRSGECLAGFGDAMFEGLIEFLRNAGAYWVVRPGKHAANLATLGFGLDAIGGQQMDIQ